MKSYKIIAFDKSQGRAFVEVTHDNDAIQTYHLPVTYEYAVRDTVLEGDNLSTSEHLVPATPEQFKQELENEISRYEQSWLSQDAVSPELTTLLEA